MTKRKLHSRVITSILCLIMLINLLTVTVYAAPSPSNPTKVELVLAADPNSNNLTLDTFSDDLKSDILNRYGIPSDQVFITSILSEQFDATKIDWHEFDHTNNSALVESTPKKLIVYDSEPYSNLIRDRHIVFSNKGRTIDFYGYGQEPYRDFLFTPDSNANNKDFTFTMNEAAVSYHTLKHGGFLFNAKYTYNADTGNRFVSGYYVGIAQGSVFLYQIDNMSVEDLMAGVGEKTINYVNQATWDTYLKTYTVEYLNSLGYYLEGTGPSGDAFKQLQAFSKPASVGGYRYLKLVASPTHVSLYQFTDNTYSTTTTGGKIIDNYQLPQNYGAFGFGPFAAYASHGCSQLTQLTFSDLSLSTNSSTSFTDLIRSINWKYEDSMKLVVNVDNDGVEEFGTVSDLGTILYYMGLQNVHYVGWGINNTISIGSDTSVMGQAESFIQRNMDKGTTIDRSDPQTNSLAEGVVVLADYIYDNLTQFSPIDPPNTRLAFGDGGAIQIVVTDDETSAGNPIGAYEWRYMDIATGVWMTSTSETATANFNFAAGSYNMVTVKIQDAVSTLWSDYTIAYIANDTDAPPVARFTTTKLPGKIVSTTNLSYHPAGEPLTTYEWKVYNAALTEVTSMVSDDVDPQFDFSKKPEGNYTIRLRVRKGDIWSSAFTQSISLVLEPQSINFPTLSVKIYGDAPFNTGASATSDLPVQYDSSNPAVAAVVDGKIEIYAAGSTTITASQDGDDIYSAADPVKRTLEVSKNSLVITAADKTKAVGQDDPELTPIYSGFVNEDTSAVVTGLSLSRAAGEDPGQYTIQASSASADNYDITYVTGKLTIIGIYTITFDSAGGNAVAAVTQDYGTAVTAPVAPTRAGYTFAGWSPAVPETMPAEDITLAAQWTINQYTITFDSASGSAVAAITQDYVTVVTAPVAPTRDGYTFAGWSPAVPETMPAEDITLTAQWTINQYTITFDSAGGSAVAAITQDYGTVVTAPESPTRSGYTFAGWYPALPETMPANGASLKATWVMIKVESDSVDVEKVEGLEDSVDLSDELEEGNDVDVILEVTLLVENEVPAGELAKVNALIANEPKPELVMAIYLDVSLFKVIGSEKENIHQTSGPITISILVPEEHRSGTNYRIVRIHDGIVDYLTAEYDPETHILTFETDRFSTYALLYDLNNIAIPVTGEKESPYSLILGTLMLMVAGGLCLAIIRRKRNSEGNYKNEI